MRSLNRFAAAAMIYILLATVGSCSLIPPNDNHTDSGSKEIRNLIGNWVIWMRLESSITSIIKGEFAVNVQECSLAYRCEIAARITIFSDIEDTIYELKGYHYPNDDYVVLKYDYITPFGDQQETTLIFDKFPGAPAPQCTLVGYFVTFSNDAPGSLHGDSMILQTSDRGQLSLAGRVTAVPMNDVGNTNCLRYVPKNSQAIRE